MQKELDELKRHIDAFIAITPELDAIARKLKDAGHENIFESPYSDGPLFAFEVKLNAGFEDDGKMFRHAIKRPDVCKSPGLADRLRAFKRKIETFESVVEGFKTRGVRFTKQDFDRDLVESVVFCAAENQKYSLELKLCLDDAIWVNLTLCAAGDQELYIDLDENGWITDPDDLELGTPITDLNEKIRTIDSATPEGQAEILDAIASRFLSVETVEKKRFRKPRRKK